MHQAANAGLLNMLNVTITDYCIGRKNPTGTKCCNILRNKFITLIMIYQEVNMSEKVSIRSIEYLISVVVAKLRQDPYH